MAVTYTVRQVIEIAQEHETMDPVRGLQLLNEANLHIQCQVHIYPQSMYTVNLVQNQIEYSLPDNVAKIWDAAYWSSASASQLLYPTNVDTLYHDYGPNWFNILGQSSGIPWGYYERGGMIGLIISPSTTTTGGYPYVELMYDQAVNLTLNSSLPSLISSPYAWIYYMASKACMTDSSTDAKSKIVKAQGYEAMLANEIKKLKRYIDGRIARDAPRIMMNIPRVRGA